MTHKQKRTCETNKSVLQLQTIFLLISSASPIFSERAELPTQSFSEAVARVPNFVDRHRLAVWEAVAASRSLCDEAWPRKEAEAAAWCVAATVWAGNSAAWAAAACAAAEPGKKKKKRTGDRRGLAFGGSKRRRGGG